MFTELNRILDGQQWWLHWKRALATNSAKGPAEWIIEIIETNMLVKAVKAYNKGNQVQVQIHKNCDLT